MKFVWIKLLDGSTYHHRIDASFRQCHLTMDAMYGRLNIQGVRFQVNGRWIDSPFRFGGVVA